ncbi:MAG: hypothetical protein WC759_03360 [Candidatus Micrarchaeia archaeon]|jgi:hypothetical protein
MAVAQVAQAQKFMPFGRESMTQEKAITRANSEKLTIVPNREFNRQPFVDFLAHNGMGRFSGPLFTGTLLAFGENRDGFVVYDEHLTNSMRPGSRTHFNLPNHPIARIRIPAEHLAKWSRSSVLFAEHGFVDGNPKRPAITIEADGTNLIFHVDESALHVIHGNFPEGPDQDLRKGYPTNKYGIPLTSVSKNHYGNFILLVSGCTGPVMSSENFDLPPSFVGLVSRSGTYYSTLYLPPSGYSHDFAVSAKPLAEAPMGAKK